MNYYKINFVSCPYPLKLFSTFKRYLKKQTNSMKWSAFSYPCGVIKKLLINTGRYHITSVNIIAATGGK